MRIHRRGFTLLELMIAITLMLIVMLMLRSMFVNAQEMYVRATRRVDVYAQARAALDLIELDLLKMRKDEDEATLNARSLVPSNWRDPKAPREDRKLYSELIDWKLTQDDQSTKIREFLSFHATATWWNEGTKQWETGNAQIVYYLRKRMDIKDQEEEGAYLVRRVIPQRSLGELAGLYEGRLKDIFPTEVDIASFVYSAQVYVDDQGAFLMGAHTGNHAYNIMPEALEGQPKWLWNSEPAPISALQPGQVQRRLRTPIRTDRVEFGGWRTSQTSLDRKFSSAAWNYPGVVMLDLTVIDRNMLRFEQSTGDGTYRSFARAVQLPLSGPPVRLDGTDISMMSGAGR